MASCVSQAYLYLLLTSQKELGAGLVLHPVQAYYTCILLSVAYVVCGHYE